MKHTKKVEALRRNLPESEEVECKNCGLKFCDEWNLLSLQTLDLCMLCANRKLDKQTIESAYDVK